jgi:hypothetical protein
VVTLKECNPQGEAVRVCFRLHDFTRKSDIAAGNIGCAGPKGSDVTSLETPIIKGDVYTTGRGGSGNMVKNDPFRPEIAREAQDVVASPRRDSGEAYSTGRGTSHFLNFQMPPYTDF